MTEYQDMEELEGMVDRHGLSGVLSMLSQVCGKKAEHLRSNTGRFQTILKSDNALAKVWDAAGEIMSALAAKVQN